MKSILKKILSPLLIILFLFSCSSDNSDNEESSTPSEAGDLFDDNGSININVLRQLNPNFSLENLETTGASNIDLLTANKFTSVTLEIISIEGFEPAPSSVDNLVAFMNERLNKPSGITVVQNSIPSPGLETYSIQQVVEKIEVPFRTQFNSGSNLAIFIFFADVDDEDSSFEDDMGGITLGTAYLNTSLVIFEGTFRKIIEMANAPSSVLANLETGTLNHELSHLLGLVNGETKQVQAHEDFQRDENNEIITDSDGKPLGNRHCNVLGCLMEPSKRFISDMMGGLQVPQLDPLCIQDLRAIGGK